MNAEERNPVSTHAWRLFLRAGAPAATAAAAAPSR